MFACFSLAIIQPRNRDPRCSRKAGQGATFVAPDMKGNPSHLYSNWESETFINLGLIDGSERRREGISPFLDLLVCSAVGVAGGSLELGPPLLPSGRVGFDVNQHGSGKCSVGCDEVALDEAAGLLVITCPRPL